MRFKEWFNLTEAPHAYGEPVTLKLGGKTYRNITCIDPRMENWPSSSTKYKETLHKLIAQGQPIRFTDDLGTTIVLQPQTMTFTVGQPDEGGQIPKPHRRYVQLTNNDKYYDVLANREVPN